MELYFLQSTEDGTPPRRKEVAKQSETKQLIEIYHDTTTYLYEFPKWLKESTKAKTEIKAMVRNAFEQLSFDNKIIVSDYDQNDIVAYRITFERGI